MNAYEAKMDTLRWLAEKIINGEENSLSMSKRELESLKKTSDFKRIYQEVLKEKGLI